jgi:hypothetical protein
MVAPLLPQAVQRARCRSTSLDVSRGPPPDDRDRARQRRVVLAALAVQPQPWRGGVQIAERGGGAERLHGRYSTPAGRVESSRYLLW